MSFEMVTGGCHFLDITRHFVASCLRLFDTTHWEVMETLLLSDKDRLEEEHVMNTSITALWGIERIVADIQSE